jgi:Cof subfamily protein (haloacid dehalogenase superfamily)
MSKGKGECMYRLVFCDFDGTIATWDGQVRPAVHAAMQSVVNAGARITISTGRGYQLVKPFLDHVAVNAPLICCNGGLIVEAHTRRVLRVSATPLALAHDVILLCHVEGIPLLCYLADMETMLERLPSDPGFVLRRDGVVIRQVPDPVREVTEPPHKLLVVTASAEETPAALLRVEQVVDGRARVLTSSPVWIEVLPPALSKARAMAWLAEHLGVHRDETIAIGDGDNDVEMLEWAGLGIAMGNATPAVKAAADWIAPSVEEDGLAVALQRFLLRPSAGQA